MLIEFSVANFLSFKEKQTLSMVANNSKELETTNTFLPIGTAKLPRLLPAVGIYGANAAGKSNLLLAMGNMRRIILSSAKESQVSEPIEGIIPHALGHHHPTEFEILFIVAGVRYQYGFAATQERITEEWLFAFPSGRPQQWLSRVYDTELKQYSWSINANQIKGKRQLWKEATRDNALFLSTAAQLNSKQLVSIFEWFKKNLQVGPTDSISPEKTFELCKKPEGKLKVLQFLNTADITVKNIELKEKEFNDLSDKLPNELKQILQILSNGTEKTKTMQVDFIHHTEDKDFQLPLQLESKGTTRLFKTAGTWLEVLEQGWVLCIDELESSLHPLMTAFLVSLFHNPEINQGQAQLIFTTHDTYVLDNDFLRRDQIWFVEKDTNQNTCLYPLSDFKPRKHEALQKGYLMGRYGALPYVSSPKWLK
ncbi:MAG: ATP-binding protein [Pseudomonadota bacterium]|nr:ATP-binding protein [Pseudomonadota bacterium]